MIGVVRAWDLGCLSFGRTGSAVTLAGQGLGVQDSKLEKVWDLRFSGEQRESSRRTPASLPPAHRSSQDCSYRSSVGSGERGCLTSPDFESFSPPGADSPPA